MLERADTGHTRLQSLTSACLMPIDLLAPLYCDRQSARHACSSRAHLLTSTSSLTGLACPPITLVAVHSRPPHQQCSPHGVAMQSPTTLDNFWFHRLQPQFFVQRRRDRARAQKPNYFDTGATERSGSAGRREPPG